MPHRSGSYTYKIKTPSRKKVIKAVTRKSFHASASTMVQSPRFLQSIIVKIALRIKEEMKKLSSKSHDSVLRDSIEGVRCFHWETVRLELVQNVPTLTALLSLLVGKSTQRSPLLCMLASMILKSRHQHMGLVQRAVSVMLYGNGTAKQV